MNRIMIPTMIIMILLMTVAFVISGVYQFKYSSGEISQDQWNDVFKIVIGIMVANIVVPVLFIGSMSLKFYIDRINFEKRQMGLETFEGPIEFSPYKTGCYQWQTEKTSYTRIDTTNRMVSRLESTRSFETIYRSISTGKGIVELDQTQLFRQMEQDIRELNNDKELKKELLRIMNIDDVDQEVQFQIPNEESFETDEEYEIALKEFDKIKENKKTDSKLSKINLIKNLFSKLTEAKKRKPAKDPNKSVKIRDGSDKSEEEDESEVVKINYDILIKMFALFKPSGEVAEHNWQIGFRYLKSIKCLDDPDYEETYIDKVTKEERYVDEILNSEAISYLIPGPEGDCFKFSTRLSNDFNAVEVNKCYASWKFLGWIIDDRVPLLVYLNSPNAKKIYNLQLSGSTISDSKLTTHVQLTYMAYNMKESLINKIDGLNATVKDYKTQTAKTKHDKISKYIDNNDIVSEIKKNVSFQAKPINVTGFLFGLLMLVLGYLLHSKFPIGGI